MPPSLPIGQKVTVLRKYKTRQWISSVSGVTGTIKAIQSNYAEDDSALVLLDDGTVGAFELSNLQAI